MAEIIRLNKVLRELNISLDRAVDFLETKNVEIEKRPTTKITSEVYNLLAGEFQTDANKKVASKEVGEAKLKEKEALRVQREQEIEEKFQKAEAAKKVFKAKTKLEGPKKVGKIDLDAQKKPTPKAAEEKPAEVKPAEDKPVEEVKVEAPKQEKVLAETPKAPEVKVAMQAKEATKTKSTIEAKPATTTKLDQVQK
jgi:translation initiation factor IF-2